MGTSNKGGASGLVVAFQTSTQADTCFFTVVVSVDGRVSIIFSHLGPTQMTKARSDYCVLYILPYNFLMVL